MRDVARFRTDVAAQVASKEEWQLITTWNEWGENSAIEPAQEWGSTYIEILAASARRGENHPACRVNPPFGG